MTKFLTIDHALLATICGGAAQEGIAETMLKYGGAGLGGSIGGLGGPVAAGVGTVAGAWGYNEGARIGRMIDRGEDRPPNIKQTERFQRR